MSRLSDRVQKLEGPKSGQWYPGPEGVVLYDGPRDGAAVVRALGLEHMEELTLEVCSEVNGALAVTGAPPKLVTKLTEGGRHGMCPEFRTWAKVSGSRFATGRAWSICWMKNAAGKGFTFDLSEGLVLDLIEKDEGK